MAPESAPAGLPQPGGTVLEAMPHKHGKNAYNGIVRRSLMQEQGPPELPAPLLPEPLAAEAPMTAPGARSLSKEYISYQIPYVQC